ncbi:MAG: hypothetical protein LBF04_02350 [Prevotellaceae bacterium]|jgi:hypothetical protein|nr:hypothetical protein [Prevotellaceae bacterium]
MKKILFFGFALLALNFIFVSCSKDNDDDTPNSLVGTSWKWSVDENDGSGDDYVIFSFINETDMTEYIGDDDKTYQGHYTYSKPVVKITVNEDDETLDIEGRVSGNKMTFTYNGGTEVFIRQ